MKKLTIIIIITIVFIDILFIFKKKEEYSQLENRYLINDIDFNIDQFFNESLTTRIQDYINDQFPFRNIFIKLNTLFNRLLMKKEINNVYFAKDNYLIEKYSGIKNYEKIVKQFNNLYDKTNSDMSLILVPTSIEINKSLLPKHVESKQYEDLQYIYKKINFKTIDVYDTLIKNNNEYQMFYKTDHHYTTFGAYFTYLEYCKNNNIDYYNMDNFNIELVSDDFYGTIYSKVVNFSQEKDKIYKFDYDYNIAIQSKDDVKDTFYYDNYLEKKDKYSYFLGGNKDIVNIVNNDIEYGSILVIKDSYANSIIPFITRHFHNIYVIDARYYNDSISDFIIKNDITKVLLLYNMNTLDKDSGIMNIK